MKRTAALLLLLLLSTGVGAAVPDATPAPKWEAPFLLRFTSGPAQASGLGLLKDRDLVTGEREVRVWIGFGLMLPEHMLRFRVSSSGDISGESFVYYPEDLSYLDPRDASAFRRKVKSRCTNFKTGAEVVICTATYKKAPDWHAIYKQLVGLGLLELPDQSTLPRPSTVLDGVAMVVEIKSGASYRAYEYSNPRFRTEPEAMNASQIMDVVSACCIRMP